MTESTGKIALLNGEQLVDQSKRIENFVLVSRGLKLTSIEDKIEEPRLDECMSNLKELLSLERVLTSSRIAKGIYEQDKNRVKLLTFSGKWDLGYFEDNTNYLRPHEALFLMEMSKLEVMFDEVVMSIEQGYAIFLDNNEEVSFEDYVVFSYLSRVGYHVSLHDPYGDWMKLKMFETRKYQDIEEKMIWCVLMERLNLPVSETFINEENQLYEETNRAMNKLNEKICGDNREQLNEPPSKKLKKENVQNFLNVLKTEADYGTHQELFQKFSFINRTEDFPTSTRELNFKFDVFVPQPNIKKIDKIPSYRIVVIRSTDDFPTNAELELLRRRQKNDISVMIAIVSESMTTRFCVCSF